MFRVLFYLFSAKLVLRSFFALTCRVKCIGFKNISKGPYLVAGNHISHFDPPLLAAYYPLKIDFMAMLDLFKHPLGNFYFTNIDTFPVDRDGADMKAVRIALKRLKNNRIVGIFPEGGLRSGKESVLGGKALPLGAAVLSQMAKVSVRPCLILGTDQLYRWQNLFKRPTIFIYLGEALSINTELSSKEAKIELNEKIMKHLREAYQIVMEREDVTDALIPRTAQERWKE